MNTYTAIVNICKDPEPVKIGERELMRIRCADNTFGKNAETRFFDALVGGPDADVAKRLKQGDAIAVTGTLVKSSYKAKKGKMKGKQVEKDDMPFAKIMQVIKSPSFFEGGDTPDEPDDAGDTTEPELDTPAADDAAGADDPMAGVY